MGERGRDKGPCEPYLLGCQQSSLSSQNIILKGEICVQKEEKAEEERREKALLASKATLG